MKLDVNVDAAAYQKLPKSFISGDTFKYTFNVPECFPDDFFELGSTTGGPTELSAQLRKVGNRGPKGFVAQLTVDWAKKEDPNNPGNEINDYTRIVVSYMKEGEPGDTSYWPICPLQFDVLFETTLSTGEVRSYRSKPILVDMVASVTTKEVLPDWGGDPVDIPTTLKSLTEGIPTLIIDGLGPDLVIRDIVGSGSVEVIQHADRLEVKGAIPPTTELSDVGSGTSLIKQGTGPDLELKTIKASGHASISESSDEVTIDVTVPPPPTVTLNDTDSGASLVNNGTGPNLSIKDLTSTGIAQVTDEGPYVNIYVPAPNLVAGDGIGISQVGDAFTITATVTPKPIVGGNGITVNEETNYLEISTDTPALTDSGSGQSLIKTAVGPTMALKRLVQGNGVNLVASGDGNSIEVSAEVTTLTSIGTSGYSLVNKGTGPDLEILAIDVGEGLQAAFVSGRLVISLDDTGWQPMVFQGNHTVQRRTRTQTGIDPITGDPIYSAWSSWANFGSEAPRWGDWNGPPEVKRKGGDWNIRGLVRSQAVPVLPGDTNTEEYRWAGGAAPETREVVSLPAGFPNFPHSHRWLVPSWSAFLPGGLYLTSRSIYTEGVQNNTAVPVGRWMSVHTAFSA